jgi:hypothetical protein
MRRLALFAALAATLITGCVSMEPRDKVAEGSSFFYGFIKPARGQVLLDVEIRDFHTDQYGKAIIVRLSRDGYYWVYNIPAGKYFIHNVTLGRKLTGAKELILFGPGLKKGGFEESSFVVEPGQIQFIGALSFEGMGGPKLFGLSGVNIHRYDQMTAKNCLAAIQPLIENEAWKARVTSSLSRASE